MRRRRSASLEQCGEGIDPLLLGAGAQAHVAQGQYFAIHARAVTTTGSPAAI